MGNIEDKGEGRTRKYNSYSFADRLKVISMKESGMSSLEIGEKLGIDSSLIRGWIRRYKKYGTEGLRPKRSRQVISRPAPAVSMSAAEHPEGMTRGIVSGWKGFVHSVDNPSLVLSMKRSLVAYGVPLENITVESDAAAYADMLRDGDTVVVNSLFDLSGSIGGILSLIASLVKNGVRLISISDCGMAIGRDGTDLAEVASALKSYVDMVSASGGPVGDSLHVICSPQQKKVRKEEQMNAALDLYRHGYTMAHSARAAGCSYNAFRYWWIKNEKKRFL